MLGQQLAGGDDARPVVIQVQVEDDEVDAALRRRSGGRMTLLGLQGTTLWPTLPEIELLPPVRPERIVSMQVLARHVSVRLAAHLLSLEVSDWTQHAKTEMFEPVHTDFYGQRFGAWEQLAPHVDPRQWEIPVAVRPSAVR